MGKGDLMRPQNKEKFDESFERIFGRKEIKNWNPDREEESPNGVHPGNPDGEGSHDGGLETQDPGNRGGVS